MSFANESIWVLYIDSKQEMIPLEVCWHKRISGHGGLNLVRQNFGITEEGV